jgi:hypothetical protein
MAETIVGLDIGRDAVTAVRISTGFRGPEILGAERVAADGPEGVAGALSGLFQLEEWKAGTCVTALSPADCVFHRLRFPFSDLKKIEKVLPMEMERFSPWGEGEKRYSHMVVRRSDVTDVLAVSVPAAAVRDRVELLRAAGVEASVIDIVPVPVALRLAGREKTGETGLYVHGEDGGWTLVLFQGGRILAVRSLSPGDAGDGTAPIPFQEIRNTCLSLFWRGDIPSMPGRILVGGSGAEEGSACGWNSPFPEIPAEPVDLAVLESIPMGAETGSRWSPFRMDTALALALRGLKREEGLNLARDVFAPRRPHRELRKHAVSAAVTLLALLILLGIDFHLGYSMSQKRLQALKDEANLLFRQTLPQVTRVVDPLQQMKTALLDMKKRSPGRMDGEGRGSVLVLLREVSRLIDPGLDFVIRGFSYDGQTVEIRGETDRFNAVDQIKVALERSDFFKAVSIASASVQGRENRVGFDLKLDLKQ